ncbi:MAG TPA: helix-turn-helix transcriptional regulator [Anaeromyxobacteraceae bacterium]|nr:helix-turn-helix transcriptional regulator [Anaeromyxobacteraceae bacterium]
MPHKTTAPRDPRRHVLRQLGARVREARHRGGLTQAEVAQSLGMSVAYMSLIERGGRNPPFTTVTEIANALGVDVRELYPD